ncbi:MAG: hypothetical protein AUJ23_00175 [Candidatus Magasanikbacteria bacterium CG1_02_32_51]|uniref:Uncharacterized protein n=1 Tax=Candidatus Magasanikbacteria bacterium CG1_02_32_51 TaxID=1805238 RepID=A0A1J4U7K4_9BACT|nr:MAG: hypothetical protein AUJ23_00175 [Candidatus Magasanikbacteria bacterium CG1_02_32_51]
MSLTEQEQQRMQRFQKVSQTMKTLNNFQTAKQTDEAIEFYKNKLKKKYQEMNQEEIEKIFQKISELLTQRTNINLKEQEYIYTTIPDFLVEEEIQKYLLANSKLILLKQKLLKNYDK